MRFQRIFCSMTLSDIQVIRCKLVKLQCEQREWRKTPRVEFGKSSFCNVTMTYPHKVAKACAAAFCSIPKI